MRTIFSLVILACIGVVGFVALSYVSMKQSVPETVQQLLDKNLPKNNLKVAFVKVPITAAIPFIGPAKSEGYFMLEKKSGGQLDGGCAFDAFTVEIREAANSSYAIYVPGEEMTRLNGCYYSAGVGQ